MSRAERSGRNVSSSSGAAAPARPRLVGGVVALALVVTVLSWLTLKARAPGAPRSVGETQTEDSALRAAPVEPPPAVPAPTAAKPAAAAPHAPAAAPPAPAAPTKPKYDPVTDVPILNSDDGVHIERTWGDPRDMQVQFRLHGKEFQTQSMIMYAAKAAHFYQEAQNFGFETKVDEAGIIRIYDPGSNTYGEYNPDGTTRTFMRPEDGAAFFEEQPGVAPMQH